jgi:hypothetical protein
MIIIDVDENTFRASGGDGMQPEFHMKFSDRIERYRQFGNMLMRSTHKTTDNDGNEIVWMDNNLKNSTMIQGMSHVNEDEWRQAMATISGRIIEMAERIERLESTVNNLSSLLQ